ncbi:hypothetical protein J2129_000006 [Methanofollis sp. W23]|uniref:hypothetical protein n=1 Tax=Methanofollis sp. W23 TaxID=2817849 RepID=UPI001AE901C5|nr:hypothetical protein [Methanofollis sp. W23]MBP2144552.1 hypothetical protein [Methanofollis sp. W23]
MPTNPLAQSAGRCETPSAVPEMDRFVVPLTLKLGVVGQGDITPALARLDGLLSHTPHAYHTLSLEGTRAHRQVASLDDLVGACDLLVISGPSETPLAVARAMGRTALLLSPGGRVRVEPHTDRALEGLRAYDAFNAEPVSPQKIDEGVAAWSAGVRAALRKAGLSSALFEPLNRSLLPHYIRARLLADRYRRCHLWAGTAVYVLAAAAIATVALQVLFLPDRPEVIWLEVAEIAAALFLLIAARTLDWHRKWLDYRVLAERMRSSLFLCFVCIRCEFPGAHPGLTLSHPSEDWMSRLFGGLLATRPLEYCHLSMPLGPLKEFLLSAWIDHQVAWYAEKARKNRAWFERLLYAGEFFFHRHPHRRRRPCLRGGARLRPGACGGDPPLPGGGVGPRGGADPARVPPECRAGLQITYSPLVHRPCDQGGRGYVHPLLAPRPGRRGDAARAAGVAGGLPVQGTRESLISLSRPSSVLTSSQVQRSPA